MQHRIAFGAKDCEFKYVILNQQVGSKPKYLGVKKYHGENVQAGGIIIRQRGTNFVAGDNVGQGKDHTLYSLINGKVVFSTKRKMAFDNKVQVKKIVSVK